MNRTETIAVVGLVVIAYLVGRWGRLPGDPLMVAEPSSRRAGGNHTAATVAPLIPVVEHGSADRCRQARDPQLTRRHYEALASEVARERRRAEYEARATRSDAASRPPAERTAEIVSLPARRQRQRA
jgi:hypothetical protein